MSLLLIDPDPLADDVSYAHPEMTTTNTEESLAATKSISDNLPPLPELPAQPPNFDPSPYTDEETLKLARKEHERSMKAYDRALKDREKAVRAREKLVQKRQKEAEKRAKQSEIKLEKEQSKRSATMNPYEYDKQLHVEQQDTQRATPVSRKQKDRKFCALPSKDRQTGKRDATWVRVYMEGIDEVVAHTSMFKPSPTYEKLVGDTVERIEHWIAEDASTRLVLAEMEQGY
jgi:hypothetical protein